jgi:hypothetical protein
MRRDLVCRAFAHLTHGSESSNVLELFLGVPRGTTLHGRTSRFVEMRNESAHDAMNECIHEFEASLRRMALGLVEETLQRELEHLERLLGGGRAKRPSKRTAPKREREKLPVPAPTVQDATLAPAGRKATWTRERIIEQLVPFLVGGTGVDAAFISRHGPKGLVAAAKKTFGRFEAAMNVASLRVSELYPDGAPGRRGR